MQLDLIRSSRLLVIGKETEEMKTFASIEEHLELDHHYEECFN